MVSKPPLELFPPNPPETTTLTLTFPDKHVLLLTLNQPRTLNVLTAVMEEELGRVMDWFDEESSLRVIVITGAGSAFCAGGDIKVAMQEVLAGNTPSPSMFYGAHGHGFGTLSRRTKTIKPIIAAVNGMAIGGGFEIVLNCDIVVASESAVFGAVETSSGLVAIHGAIPRMSRLAGHQLASEVYLLARKISAREACDRYCFVNRIVPQDQVLPTALELARRIVDSFNSLDSMKRVKEVLLRSRL